MKSICIFCGSSLGFKPAYKLAARAVGETLARRGLRLIYGGGNVGLMGTVADAALAASGEVIGVIPEFLVAKEIAHQGLTRLHVVESMHERKALMADLADAFVALPGGYGTLEEFCEVLTWTQLGLHQKPLGLLNVENYYDPLLQWFDQARTEGFLKTEMRSLVLHSSDPEALLNQMSHFQPPQVDKWIKTDVET